jgi:hypothetical protein
MYQDEMNLTEDKKEPLRKKTMTERRNMLSMWLQKDVSFFYFCNVLV